MWFWATPSPKHRKSNTIWSWPFRSFCFAREKSALAVALTAARKMIQSYDLNDVELSDKPQSCASRLWKVPGICSLESSLDFTWMNATRWISNSHRHHTKKKKIRIQSTSDQQCFQLPSPQLQYNVSTIVVSLVLLLRCLLSLGLEVHGYRGLSLYRRATHNVRFSLVSSQHYCVHPYSPRALFGWTWAQDWFQEQWQWRKSPIVVAGDRPSMRHTSSYVWLART